VAVITLVANTDYSALSVADGDTIALSTFTLNLDAIPAQINVIVSTASTGKMTLLSATNYPLTGWTMTAGTGALIASVPVGTTLGGTLIGGSAGSAFGCTTNSGTITHCKGGAFNGAVGVSTNNGTITTAAGGTVNGGHGCSFNNGTITNANAGFTSIVTHGCTTNNASGLIVNATGGGTNFSQGCVTNNGTITNCTGGSFNNAFGVSTNNGTITNCTGGSGVQGCNINNGTVITAIATAVNSISTNNGVVLNITNAAAIAVNTWNGSRAFCIGDGVRGTIPSNITTLYVQGALHASAIVSGSTTVIVLSSGTARPFHPLSTPQVIG